MGVMGRDFVGICPAYMASTTAVPARYITPNTTGKDQKQALESLLPRVHENKV